MNGLHKVEETHPLCAGAEVLAYGLVVTFAPVAHELTGEVLPCRLSSQVKEFPRRLIDALKHRRGVHSRLVTFAPLRSRNGPRHGHVDSFL